MPSHHIHLRLASLVLQILVLCGQAFKHSNHGQLLLARHIASTVDHCAQHDIMSGVAIVYSQQQHL
eukprot:972621-Lingulodinium_polyedra.AAC.1